MKSIRHILIFNFKNEISEKDQQNFLEQMKTLEAISGISNFGIAKQIHAKTKFKHVLTMDFDSDESYQIYVKDPINRAFVNNFWLAMVDDYMVIDNEITTKK